MELKTRIEQCKTSGEAIEINDQIASEIAKLNSLKYELNVKLQEVCEFKQGDKVIVSKGNRQQTVFVGRVSFEYDGTVSYKFLKMKKNGTASVNSAGIYRPDSITKATE